MRRFLWRAFLTSRYEQLSTSNAYQDFRGLRRLLTEGVGEDGVPILNEESYPTWRTHRAISNKDPIAHLKERADNSTLGEAELRR